MKEKRKRFVFIIPSEVYELLKYHSINRNIPMSRYVIQAIISAIKLEVE